MRKGAWIALSLLVSAVTFVSVMFFVAWLLKSIMFFSVLVGIPAGAISAAVVFVVLLVRSKRSG